MIWSHGQVPAPRSRLSGLLSAVLMAVLGAGLLVLATPAPAQACTCATQDTESFARQARAVFTGTVGEVVVARPGGADNNAEYTHEVSVDLVYKGRVDSPEIEVVTGGRQSGGCGLGRLAADENYTFFVRLQGEVLMAAPCGGTSRTRPALTAQLEALYGEGMAPTPAPTPVEAEITPVAAAAEPADLSRALAPGAAMVLIGLLGLMLFRRLGRR